MDPAMLPDGVHGRLQLPLEGLQDAGQVMARLVVRHRQPGQDLQGDLWVGLPAHVDPVVLDGHPEDRGDGRVEHGLARRPS
jgi:hypothetical protein